MMRCCHMLGAIAANFSGSPKGWGWWTRLITPHSEAKCGILCIEQHRVRPSQEGRGKRETEGRGRLPVDHELESRGWLDGEVRRLRPLQDLIHQGGGAPEELGHVRPVG